MRMFTIACVGVVKGGGGRVVLIQIAEWEETER